MKKFFIKICKFFGFEIIDQNEFTSPTLNKELNEDLSILNKKSILLLNYNSDWRWFDDNDQTIWYPSVDIIKQEKFASWDEVFVKLENKIKSLK